MVVVVGVFGVCRGKLPGVVLHQLSPRKIQVACDGLSWRGVGGVGLLVVTSSGERRKAPLLGTYGDDVPVTKPLIYYDQTKPLILGYYYQGLVFIYTC